MSTVFKRWTSTSSCHCPEHSISECYILVKVGEDGQILEGTDEETSVFYCMRHNTSYNRYMEKLVVCEDCISKPHLCRLPATICQECFSNSIVSIIENKVFITWNNKIS